MKLDAAPCSYRADDAVPRFADAQPIIVFDGVCVLCSGFLRFVLRHDRRERFRFVIAQSPLGQALYRHYGLNPTDFETNLVIDQGRVFTKLAAVAAVLYDLGGIWKPLALIRLIPLALGDWLYDRIAKNRYRLFGRTEFCMVPTPQIRSRFLDA